MVNKIPTHPICVQVEAVEGCNRRCWFCGIRGVPPEQAKGDRFMDLALVEKVFTECHSWLGKMRVEINSHGEPTLHPEFPTMLQVMRKAMPGACLQLQTNGQPWQHKLESYVPAMFEAGLNVLAVNCYQPGLFAEYKERFAHLPYKVVDFFWDNAEHLSFNHRYRPSTQVVFLIDDLGSLSQKHQAFKIHPSKRIHNSGGNSDAALQQKMMGKEPLQSPKQTRCSKVFREFILNWDGKVPVCCQDWRNETVLGDLAAGSSIKQLWYGEQFMAIRRLLWQGKRAKLRPCATCDDPTTRVGLIWDPFLTGR